MLSYRLRRATDADVPALVQMINLAYAAEVAALYKRDRMDNPMLLELLADGELVVADCGTIGGCVHIKQVKDRCEIGTLAVEPERQGAGLGRLLIEAGEAWARARACVAVELGVINHNKDLIRWYQKLGYQVAGDVPFPYPNETKQPCHLVWLTKPLV